MAETGGKAGPCTVLVVEDEAAVRLLACTALRAEGHTVLEAADAPAAEKVAGKYGVPLDLLVVDYVLPGMDGRELAGRLRPRFPGMKVLFISGHAEEEPVQDALLKEAFKEGAAFLQKPFGPEALARKVRSVLLAY